MSQIEKEFLAEECGLDDSHVYNSGDGTDPIMNPCKGCAYQNVVHKECIDCSECSEFKEATPISFAPRFYKRILNRTKILTVESMDRSGEFTIDNKRFNADFEIAMTIPAFKSLFDNEFYIPDQFGFDTTSDMWDYYHGCFKNLIFVHKISEVEG